MDTGATLHPVLASSIIRSSGCWAATLQKQEPDRGGEPSMHTAGAVFSADGRVLNGATVVARDPDDTLSYYDQRQAGDVEADELAAAFWTYGCNAERDVDIHFALGDRSRREREAPRPTGIAGQIATPVRLTDGRLALFCVHRNPPCSMRLVVSPDGGRSWDLNDELVVYEHATADGNRAAGAYAELWDDIAAWTFGHPPAARVPDGTLLAYYAGPRATDLSVHWSRVGS